MFENIMYIVPGQGQTTDWHQRVFKNITFLLIRSFDASFTI